MRATSLLFLLVLASAACRPLDYPASPSGKGPTLSFLRPQGENPRLTLTEHVSLEAIDPQGVAGVRLECGPLQDDARKASLELWRAPPYQGTVQLGACRAFLSGASGMIRLIATAVDQKGNTSQVSLPVELDTSLAGLDLQVPTRAGPGLAVLIKLSVDGPLLGAPSLWVDGTPVALTGGPLTFEATLATPQLGAPASPETPPTLLMLEDLERTLAIVAEVRAESGNLTRKESLLVVSPELWRRPSPGVLMTGLQDPAARPVATPKGLHLPLAIERADGSLEWVPGQVDPAGRFVAAPSVPYRYRGYGFDRDGNALLNVKGDLTQAMKLISANGEVLQQSTTFPEGLLTRVGDSVCVYEAQAPLSCPLASGPGATHVLTCLSALGQLKVTSAGPPNDISEGPPMPQWVASSGEVFAAFELGPTFKLQCTSCPSCTVPKHVVGPVAQNGLKVFQPGVAGSYVTQVHPTGTGGLIIGTFDPNLRFDTFEFFSSAGSGQAYFGRKALLTQQLAGARRDGSALTLEVSGGQSLFRAWTPGQLTPSSGPVAVPGEYALTVTETVYGHPNVAFGPQGQVVLLVKTHEFGRAVLVLHPNLSPRWLYRYALPTAQLELVVSDSSPLMYLVDPSNQQLTALTRPW